MLHVLYLIFNEGYASSIGTPLQRNDLAAEAIRLTRIVHRLLPRDTEVAGLLALMLLTDARRAARTGPEGELIPLPEQDRTLWDREAIAEGIALIAATLAKGRVGPYQLQAAVAALHDEAARHEDTDWAQIAALYGVLMRISDNPMVALNQAIAVAMVEGPAAGLAPFGGARSRTHASPGTIGWTPSAGICTRWPAIAPRRSRTTRRRPQRPRACRREIT